MDLGNTAAISGTVPDQNPGSGFPARKALTAFGVAVDPVEGMSFVKPEDLPDVPAESESRASSVNRYCRKRKIFTVEPQTEKPEKRQLREDIRLKGAGMAEFQLKKARDEAVTCGHGVSVRTRQGYRGLYADRPFQSGRYITKVDGERKVLSHGEMKDVMADPVQWQHMIAIQGSEVIFGLKEPENERGGGSFVNDGGISELTNNNAEMTLVAQQDIYVRAIQDIREDEEILVDYGKQHWELVKKHQPETYDSLFKDQVRSHEELKQLITSSLASDPKGKLKVPLEKLNRTPVPAMPEIKPELQDAGWNESLLRYYASSRMGMENVLTIDSLRQLNPESEEYFESIMEHCKSLTPNIIKKPYKHFTIPFTKGNVFRDAEKWSSPHINYFCWKVNNPSFAPGKGNFTNMLGVVDPASSEYSLILMGYFQLYFGDLEELDCLDLVEGEQERRMELVAKNLRRNKPALPIGIEGLKHVTSWSKEAILTILNHHGIGVNYRSYSSTQHLWPVLARAALAKDEDVYYKTLQKIADALSYKYGLFHSLSKKRKAALERLPDTMTGVRYDPDYSTSYWFAVDAMGRDSGVTEDMLQHIGWNNLAKVLPLISTETEKGKQVSKTIMEILANSYKLSHNFRICIKHNNVVLPENETTWDALFYRLRQNKHQWKITHTVRTLRSSEFK